MWAIISTCGTGNKKQTLCSTTSIGKTWPLLFSTHCSLYWQYYKKHITYIAWLLQDLNSCCAGKLSGWHATFKGTHYLRFSLKTMKLHNFLFVIQLIWNLRSPKTVCLGFLMSRVLGCGQIKLCCRFNHIPHSHTYMSPSPGERLILLQVGNNIFS